ncbi:putative molybdopterin biosynthesis protein [Melghirimyces algeriensis]|uniref:Molybdopterin molybdenumtransferase n=1 Tax=Melghirimyces algeriensis TaxID=910412 RepID=A0A521FE26_9BACL|nr:putative molybdopterin biosynthesis protein [Melghirimyces algeriensis]
MRNTRLDSIPRDEALHQLLTAVDFHPEKEEVSVSNACGRVTSHPVIAERSMPPHASAAMDGIAVQAEMLQGASLEKPVLLREGRDFIYINTGDLLPSAFDSVVMIEKVKVVDKDRVQVDEPVNPWKHVRQPGEDVAEGEVILSARHTIRPVDQGVLLAAGVEQVSVLRRPRVGILPTGSEMVPPGLPLERGQLREFNGTVFKSLLEECGAEPDYRGVVPDRKEILSQEISRAVDMCDMVVVNAGSSAGSRDFTPKVLQDLGDVLLHGVATRPGKPVVIAVVKGKPVLGLPGYPVSAYLSFDWFVRPLIQKWYGLGRDSVHVVSARLNQDVQGKMGAEDFIRMQTAYVNGEYVASPLPGGAGVTMSVVRAASWLRIPQDVQRYHAGERVTLELVKPLEAIRKTLLLAGCDDPLLDWLGAEASTCCPGWSIQREVMEEEEGWKRLRNGGCHALVVYRRAGTPDGFVRICIAERDMGWITGSTVSKPVTCAADLLRPGLRFINLPPGSGIRERIKRMLEAKQNVGSVPNGWERVETSHWKAAASLSEGTADVMVGPYSVAKHYGLIWRPAWVEPLDLIVPVTVWEETAGNTLKKILLSQAFRSAAQRLGGYNLSQMGQLV